MNSLENRWHTSEHTERESKQLGNVGLNVDGGLTDTEQLVHKGQDDGEQAANSPGTDRGARHAGIILVVDNGAHLSVGAVVGDEGSLELHLVDELSVLLRVLEDIFVLCSLC